ALSEEKSAHEQGRLLYVAATRAIRCLDLFGFVKRKPSDGGAPELAAPELAAPERGSLLARLWPAAEPAFRAALGAGERPGDTQGVAAGPAGAVLARLTAD